MDTTYTPAETRKASLSLVWVGGSLAIVIAAAVLVTTWRIPFSQQQGVYSACASIILDGGIPYRDCWDLSGPSQHYTYALAQVIFGETAVGVHILYAMVTVIAAAGLGWLLILWGINERLAVVGGVIYGLLTLLARFDMAAHPEGFANAFVIAGLLTMTLAIRADRAWLHLISGLFLAIAVFYKYVLLLPFLAAGVALALTMPGGKPRRTILLTSGGTAFFLAVSVVYLAAVGALGQALEHITFIIAYLPRAVTNPIDGSTLGAGYGFVFLPVFMIMAAAGVVFAFQHERWPAWALTAYLVASLVTVWVQGPSAPAYWLITLPPVALCGTMLIDALLKDGTFACSRWIGFAIAGLVVLNVGVFGYTQRWLVSGVYRTGALDEETFLSTQGLYADITAAEYVAERTTPDETVWVWGEHAEIYTLAERRSPTRFVYAQPLTLELNVRNPWVSQWQAEALDALYDAPPAYVLVDRAIAPPEAVEQFVERHYTLEYEADRFQFYRLQPYWSRRNDAALLDAVTIIDLLELEDATIQQADPPVEVMSVELEPAPPIPSLRLHPPAALTTTIDLPEGTVCLRFDSIMYPESWRWGGDGAGFIVEVDGERVFASYLTNTPADFRWHENVIDLSAYAGQQVTLTLRSEPGTAQDFTGDWAMWGLPRIVQPPAGAACTDPVILKP